jgi:two-component system NtrC family response regulator
LVSATHRPLAKLASGGLFREDLFYRISELVIEVPPLRERPEDALVLARHLLDELRDETRSPLLQFGSDALAAVAGHAWPGNVRELENRVKRAVVLAEGSRVRAADLGLETPASALDGEGSLRATLGALERDAVTRAWSESGHNVSLASRLLGVSRPTLYKLLRAHGLRS